MKTKAALTPKRKKFARAYVETGNATAAYEKSFDTSGYTSRKSLQTEATRTRDLPVVQSEVARIMRDSGMDMPDVIAIHRRNMQQDKHLPTSQRAVETYYQLEGIMAKAEAPKLSVAFVIHSDAQPTEPQPKTHEVISEE